MAKDQLYIQHVFTLLDVIHALRQRLTRVSQRLTGLTLQQCLLLSAVERKGGRLTVTELANAISRATHTVTASADKLERLGLVTRQHERSNDRRRVWLEITTEGSAKVSEFHEGVAKLLLAERLEPAWSQGGLRAEGLEQVTGIIERYVATLDMPKAV